MSESHAIAVAVNAAKKMCATGELNFPGHQTVNPGSRAEACAAVAAWTAKKAQAHADNRSEMSELETRTVDVDLEQVRTEGNKLIGHAAVFNVESEDLGGFRERIAPGAFSGGVLDADVRLLVDHKPPPLARTKAKTLRLYEDATGLAFEADLPDTQYARDLRTSLTRGDLDGMSFSFTVADEDWEGDVRTVKRVASLRDVCIATYPAYLSTSVQLRTRPNNDKKDGNMETETRDSEPVAPDPTTASTSTPASSVGTSTSTGGLSVESRTASDGKPSVEMRVVQALRSVKKGESRTLTAVTAGEVTPPELSTLLFEKLRAGSVVLQSGVRVISTDRREIVWPKLNSDVDPQWYAETDEIVPGDPGFTSLTATPKKLAHIVNVSNECVDDSDPSITEVLTTHLTTMLGTKLDYFLLQGDGTPPGITGLRSVANIQTVQVGSGDGAALDDLDPFADAVAALEGANVPGPYVAVMHPEVWSQVRKLKDQQDRPLLQPDPTADAQRSIFGARTFTTSQLSTDETEGSNNDATSVYIYSPGQIVFIRRQEIEVEWDRALLFNYDSSSVRAKVRADLLVPNAESVVRVHGIRPAA
jgi:HK97 family phage major capsid protein/HK97 family phage prohead protease